MHFFDDITGSEAFALAGILLVPSVIAYLLGQRCSRTWLGLLVAILWLPSLLLFCGPAARATIFGATLLSFFPAIIAFTCGVARRPLKAHDRSA